MKDKKINSVLIANRGEIALRILKTLKKLNLHSVGIFSRFDLGINHTAECDLSILMEGDDLNETYLNIDQIIKIARETGVDAIHPGYGFLSENEKFAAACEKNGIIFIGAKKEHINKLGDKISARKIAKNIGIPVVDGFDGPFADEELEKQNIPFPLMIKASGGGGGRGMRIVHDIKELKETWEIAKLESQKYFHNPEVFIEKYIPDAKHIEVQVIGDQFGNIIHLFDRECSIQRRFQKIIEEAPSPSLENNVRSRILDDAIKLCKSVGYIGAGTVEFLLDKNGNYYFLEMNTRLQVEHPITEEITGIDIVAEQVKVAEGRKLTWQQDDIKMTGHAIEARICAEKPFDNFMPSTGRVVNINWPDIPNLRTDSGITTSNQINDRFDSLLCKIISFGRDRNEAIQTMARSLEDFSVHGIVTNQYFISSIINHQDFIQNRFYTSFIEKNRNKIINQLKQKENDSRIYPVLIGAYISILYHNSSIKSNLSPRKKTWSDIGYWRIFENFALLLNANHLMILIKNRSKDKTEFIFNQKKHHVHFIHYKNNILSFYLDGKLHKTRFSEEENKTYIDYNGLVYTLKTSDILNSSRTSNLQISKKILNGQITAPLNGRISKLMVKENDSILKGDTLLIIESMKMENKVVAHKNGIVKKVSVKEGDQINTSMIIIELE